jgi:hypothetical protein
MRQTSATGSVFVPEEITGSNSLYNSRLRRYVTALRNEKPDRVPVRPFVAEFTARYAGMSCQEVTHDYRRAFEAALLCARDFGWDAVVPNMVYVWTGLTEALGLRYYGVPGIHIPADRGFNYIEPPEDKAWMREDEYDALIDDPTRFLYEKWLPRVSSEVGSSSPLRAGAALVKAAAAMTRYFSDFGPQVERLRHEAGAVPAISGIFKAPFDIIADKLRGYIGLTMDMRSQPDKVLAACEALMPHLCHVGLSTSDPSRRVPIAFWMHRGCVPFISPAQFDSHYWPTLKPIIEEFWKQGRQTLFYAEGKWSRHFEAFRELPERSIVFHCDRDDIFEAHRRLHDRFALSGGIPNALLSYGSPGEVRDFCRRVLDEVRGEGGYILDAGAIVQNDTPPENIRAMTETVTESEPADAPAMSDTPPADLPASIADRADLKGMDGAAPVSRPPGTAGPFTARLSDLPPIQGDERLVRRIWQEVDTAGYDFIWQLLLSF